MAGPGQPKTGGRQPGVKNKIQSDIKVLAQAWGPDAIAKLARLAGLTDEPPATAEVAQVSAVKELLDRGYGKSRQQVDGTVTVNLDQLILDAIKKRNS